MRQSPAFVGIFNDFENLVMLALNEEAWGIHQKPPGKLLGYSPVLSVLLQELHCHCYPCSRIVLWPTFTCSRFLHFQSSQILQHLKEKSEQQPMCVRQENAMLKNWNRFFGWVSVMTEVKSLVPADNHPCPLPLHCWDNEMWSKPSTRKNISAARETLML